MLAPRDGRFGRYGGRFVPESLVPACAAVEEAFRDAWADPAFRAELDDLLHVYAGRPTPLTPARTLSAQLGITLLIKREDLVHTGSHKINNVLGQALLARRMGKRRLIAETGAGQHGVATATAAALLGLQATVYMGERDIDRQRLNVFRMTTLGAEVIPVTSGSRTLKDATNEAMRAWVSAVDEAHFLLGSVSGPHPYPWMVREFQRVIGDEARSQAPFVPDVVVACVGGGSNAAGTFAGFAGTSARLVGVEAAGGTAIGRGAPGVVHGTRSLLLQDADGQIAEATSIAAGLDYPGVGPEHAHLADIGRAEYHAVTDAEVVAAVGRLARSEGIICALESAHAVAWVVRSAGTPLLPHGSTVVLTLSGRGDKDMATLAELAAGPAELLSADSPPAPLSLASPSHAASPPAAPHPAAPPAAEPSIATPPLAGGAASAVCRAPLDRSIDPAAPGETAGDVTKTLVPYVTAGVTADWTDYLIAYQDAGADLIEIGLPFSDPMLDGVTIQRASDRALARGTTVDGVFADLARVRDRITVPLIVMTYANLVLRRGPEAFCERLAAAGITGLIVPDLPVDECADVERAAAATGVDLILLAAPVTPDARLAEIAERSRGFVYAVNVMGTTGERPDHPAPAAPLTRTTPPAQTSAADHTAPPAQTSARHRTSPSARTTAPNHTFAAGEAARVTLDKRVTPGERVTLGSRIRAVSDRPVLVGFGISSPAQAAAAGRSGDAVVVASALMRKVLDGGTPDDLRHEVAALRAALDHAERVRHDLEESAEHRADRRANAEISGDRG